MTRIRLYVDSNANIHSKREEVYDLEKELGITPEEWEKMTEDEKEKMFFEMVCDLIEWDWEELD
jgi:hypothetical protein